MSLATTAFAAAPNPNSGNATGTVNVAFSYQMTANQAIPSGGWGGTGLPPGLTGPSATGLISGIPTTAGTYTVHLTATNTNGTGTKDVTFTINLPSPPSLNGNNNATGTVGVAFSYQISATNNPTSYNATGLPPGLTVNATTGLISGIPTTVGTYSVTLSATNAGGTGTKGVTFKINTGPTSIATISPTAVWVGDTVTLDGNQSHTNPPGGTLDYNWQQLAPSTGTLSIALTPAPPNEAAVETFTAPAPQPLGTLSWPVTYNLKVTDNSVSGGAKNTTSDPVTTTVYAAPVADAEPKDAHVNEGTLVTLNGNATMVQPGATLSYTWMAPNGIVLSDVHAQNPTFTAPFVGPAGQALTFTLVVTEHLAGLAHDQNSAPDSVTINVDNVNAPPTAYASSDPNSIVSMAEVDENTAPVTLYGFGTDPDGDAVSFTWTQVHDTSGALLQQSDTVVVLSDNNSTTPSFTAPDVSTAQQHIDLVFQLITNDGHLNSGPSYVTIRVNNTNDPPVASPGVSPASALEGDVVMLDGSLSSDPNGDTLTYTWAQVGTPAVTLSDIHAAMPTFTAPAVSAQKGGVTLTFELTVSDGELTDTKPVSITVAHKNVAPVADAGQLQTLQEGVTAYLDGSNSYDPEGDDLTFAWTQVDGTSVTLTSVTPDNKQVSFIAPDVGVGGGILHFQLTVTDSHGASNSANVEIDVTYVNRPPVADAGNNQNVKEGETVSLSGSGSDPDGNTLTYAWSQFSGPPVTIVPDPVDSSKATFIAPQVFCAGDLVVMRLTADDGYGGTATSDVTINIANVNHSPTANGGGNQTNISEGAPVELHGTGDDADTEEVGSLTFKWTQTSGPAVTLSGSGKDRYFTAPSVGGGDPNAFIDLGFHLLVTDSCGGSATDDITVHVANIPHAPVAVAQGGPTANEGGDNVTLDGSGSNDPDNDPLTYTWTQCGGPAVALSYDPADVGHVMPMFTTPWVSADTPLKFKLTVSDPYGGTSSAYVTVTIINWHTPPNVTNARADVAVLWPPDHKMLSVQVLGVVMPSDDKITIDKVTQDEPTNGLGDGDTPIDAIIRHNAAPDNDTLNLRAERSGKGDGRVYKVYFTVADPEATAHGVVNVMVPHDKKTDAAIDSGGAYDSTH